MNSGSATRRIRALDAVRRGCAGGIHAGRKIVISNLRGQADHSTLLSTATYSPWLVDDEFKAVAATVRHATLLDEMRLYELWQLADQVGHLSGDAIEVGCWRGGAGVMIAKRIAARRPEATMFLCDTFTGVVKAGAEDSIYRGGEHGDADYAAVMEVAGRVGASNVDVLTGVFPDETGDRVEDRDFKFAHIDVDVYEGARDSFQWLLPRLSVGGIVVFDDYGSTATDGIRSFVDQLHGHPDVAIVRNFNGQAVAVRRSAATPAAEASDRTRGHAGGDKPAK